MTVQSGLTQADHGQQEPTKKRHSPTQLGRRGALLPAQPSTAAGSCRGNGSPLPRGSQLDTVSRRARAKAGKGKLALAACPKELVPGSVVSVINMSSYIIQDRELITYKRS